MDEEAVSTARAGESGRHCDDSLAVITLAVIFGIWEFVSQTEIVNPVIVPPASEVWSCVRRACPGGLLLGGDRGDGEGDDDTASSSGSSRRWILGTLIGLFRVFRLAFYPLVIAFQITPRIALAPLFLTWFGFGLTSKVVMAATICFFPVLIAVVVGLETSTRTLAR